MLTEEDAQHAAARKPDEAAAAQVARALATADRRAPTALSSSASPSAAVRRPVGNKFPPGTRVRARDGTVGTVKKTQSGFVHIELDALLPGEQPRDRSVVCKRSKDLTIVRKPDPPSPPPSCNQHANAAAAGGSAGAGDGAGSGSSVNVAAAPAAATGNGASAQTSTVTAAATTQPREWITHVKRTLIDYKRRKGCTVSHGRESCSDRHTRPRCHVTCTTAPRGSTSWLGRRMAPFSSSSVEKCCAR